MLLQGEADYLPVFWLLLFLVLLCVHTVACSDRPITHRSSLYVAHESIESTRKYFENVTHTEKRLKFAPFPF